MQMGYTIDAKSFAAQIAALSAVIYAITEALKRQPSFDVKAFETEMRQVAAVFPKDTLSHTMLLVLSGDRSL